MAKYPKGSEWRIWDLHIHTPGTAKNDQYGNDEAAWETYIAKLEENTDVTVKRIFAIHIHCLLITLPDAIAAYQ